MGIVRPLGSGSRKTAAKATVTNTDVTLNAPLELFQTASEKGLPSSALCWSATEVDRFDDGCSADSFMKQQFGGMICSG